MKVWRARPFGEKKYPFIIVDALIIDVRRDDAVRATGCLIAYGIMVKVTNQLAKIKANPEARIRRLNDLD